MRAIVGMGAVAMAALLVLTPTSTRASASREARHPTGIVKIYSQVTSTSEQYGMVIRIKRLRDDVGHTIGWADTVCFPLNNGFSQCVGTYTLPRGKIMVAGTRRSIMFYVFAVTGGTGFYDGAKGSLIARSTGGKELLLFSLTG